MRPRVQVARVLRQQTRIGGKDGTAAKTLGVLPMHAVRKEILGHPTGGEFGDKQLPPKAPKEEARGCGGAVHEYVRMVTSRVKTMIRDEDGSVEQVLVLLTANLSGFDSVYDFGAVMTNFQPCFVSLTSRMRCKFFIECALLGLIQPTFLWLCFIVASSVILRTTLD